MICMKSVLRWLLCYDCVRFNLTRVHGMNATCGEGVLRKSRSTMSCANCIQVKSKVDCSSFRKIVGEELTNDLLGDVM